MEFGLRSGKAVIEKYQWETHQLVPPLPAPTQETPSKSELNSQQIEDKIQTRESKSFDSPTASGNGKEAESERAWPAMVVLASEGIAAEYGCNLGQYSQQPGEHNKAPYYLHSHTLRGGHSPPVYLYRADDNQWYVGSIMGKRGGWLQNPSDCLSVPKTGWKVTDDKGIFTADPQLTVSYRKLTPCGDITVASNGPTASKMGYYLGVYRRTDMISSGRMVFKHQTLEKYLSIAPGTTVWSTRDKPGADTGGIQSAAGANCPASNKNRYNKRLDKKSWMFSDNGEWHEDPSITVTCTHHNPDYY